MSTPVSVPEVVRPTLLIAIVDDEESVRKALQRLMRSAGLDAAIYPSGDEFLKTVLEQRPDCVVLDLHMPKVDGFQVQASLAKARISIPVIVLTGQDTPESRERAMAGGAAAYLRKPVDDQVLLDTINAAVGERK